MNKTFIITGAAGFLGSLLIIDLMARGDALICVGRAKNGVTFQNRLLEKLKFFGYAPDKNQLTTIELDIDDPIDKVMFSGKNIDGIWHLAANLSFKKKDRNAVYKTNVGGTKNMAELSEKLDVPLFYIGTAYVHGKRNGFIKEDDLIRPTAFNNYYEESKFEAEKILRDWKNKDNKLIVFRPSILIETRDNPVPYFGYYVIISVLAKLTFSFEAFLYNHPILSKLTGVRKTKDRRLFIPFPFPNSKKCLIDFVPVSWVIEWMLLLSERTEAFGKTFHLVNPNPFPFKQVIDETFMGIGIKMPIITLPPSFVYFYFWVLSVIGIFSPAIAFVSRKMYYYKTYMIDYYIHDMHNVKSLIKDFSKYSIPRGTLTDITKRSVTNFKTRT